jgi:hypothetical protein
MTKPSGNPKGRPSKSDLAAIKENRPVGRPKGTKAIIDGYVQRMLASPKSAKVLEAIFDAALDPENKNQAAAWKLVIDRVAPISAFDVTSKGGSGVPQISINISGLNSPSVNTEQVYDVSDVEYTEREEEVIDDKS